MFSLIPTDHFKSYPYQSNLYKDAQIVNESGTNEDGHQQPTPPPIKGQRTS